jgi:hypothetical protein
LEIDPETEERYFDLLDLLFALEFDKRDGEDCPHVISLSPEAKAVWVKWYNAWAKEQAAVEGELAAMYSKIEEAAARIALLHHTVSRLGRGQSDLGNVERESIEAGITLARWFARESRRVYAVLAESDEQRDARQLVEFIRRRGGKITVRELQRANGRKYPDAAAAEAALNSLVEAGLATWMEPADGKRSRVLELCPTLDTSDRADTEASPSQPDGVSDGTGAPSTFPSKNGQMSDVSDSRTEPLPPSTEPTQASASDGSKGQASDNSSSDGPYREGY